MTPGFERILVDGILIFIVWTLMGYLLVVIFSFRR